VRRLNRTGITPLDIVYVGMGLLLLGLSWAMVRLSELL
jgi:hypothetical protein